MATQILFICQYLLRNSVSSPGCLGCLSLITAYANNCTVLCVSRNKYNTVDANSSCKVCIRTYVPVSA